MYTPLNDSLGKEKLILKASAATVGRPTGVDGKKRIPRRARVTSKELEKLTTKGLKAGGPGSGRHAEMEKVAKKFGYRYRDESNNDKRYTRGHPTVKGLGHELIISKTGKPSWSHASGKYKDESWSKKGLGTGPKSLEKHLTSTHGKINL